MREGVYGNYKTELHINGRVNLLLLLLLLCGNRQTSKVTFTLYIFPGHLINPYFVVV